MFLGRGSMYTPCTAMLYTVWYILMVSLCDNLHGEVFQMCPWLPENYTLTVHSNQ